MTKSHNGNHPVYAVITFVLAILIYFLAMIASGTPFPWQ